MGWPRDKSKPDQRQSMVPEAIAFRASLEQRDNTRGHHSQSKSNPVYSQRMELGFIEVKAGQSQIRAITEGAYEAD